MNITIQVCVIVLTLGSFNCLVSLKDSHKKAIKKSNMIFLNKIMDRTSRKNGHGGQVDVDHDVTLVQNRLKHSLRRNSALLDRPYVEHEEQIDFLVMQPIPGDSFVTVVPNFINYDIEKTCVNWLDDCSIQGIRNSLLKGVNTPYRKK